MILIHSPFSRHCIWCFMISQCHYNNAKNVKHHRQHDSLFKSLFRLTRMKRESSASLAFLWGHPPVTGRLPSQKACNSESVSTWWRNRGTITVSLRWRHNGRENVSNHQPHDCLLNRLFRRRSKKTSKLRVTGLCVGNSPGPVNSPHKGPVTRKMFPFDDVIMIIMGVITPQGWYCGM